MLSRKLAAIAAAFAMFLAAPAVAQATLTVDSAVLTEGTTATIEYHDPSRGGQTVTIEIDNGEGTTETIPLPLDQDGRGSKTWTVPSWKLAKFNAPDAPEVFCPIQP